MSILDQSEEVQRKIIAQYEAIRRSGVANMLDREVVRRIAIKNNFEELASFMEDRQAYVSLLREYTRLISMITQEDIPQLEGRVASQIDALLESSE